MTNFPIKVKWKCDISNYEIFFTIPNGFTIQPCFTL